MLENQNIPVDRDFMERMYERRILVMLENEDGGFVQVLFDKKHFKKVSDAVMRGFHSEKDQNDTSRDWVDVAVGQKVIPASSFDGMESSQ